MANQRDNRPILVTGAHRSGSTFVGRMLSLNPTVGYVSEPFNRDHGLEGIDRWFLYLREGMDEEPAYRQLFERFLAGRARYKRGHRGGNALVRTARFLMRSRNQMEYRRTFLDPRVKRLLVKDPIACLSSEYLHRRFGMDVVVILRHPAAFVASLGRMDWRFDFADLTEQPALMRDHLAAILGEIPPSGDIARSGALLWNCLYSVLDNYAQANPGMIVVRHEDLSRDPQASFAALYARLGLDHDASVRHAIESHTSAANPAAPREGKVHTLSRDSAGNVQRWKTLLSEDEVAQVREITEALAARHYDESDW